MDKMRFVGPVLARVPPAAWLPGSVRLAVERALTRWPRQFAKRPTRYGFTMSGQTGDLIDRYVYSFGVWEPVISEWITGHLQPGDVVVDVGANVGWVSLLAASIVGVGGRVYAVEPVPSIVARLRRNVAENGYDDRVTVLPVALSDEQATVTAYRSPGVNTGQSSTFGGEGFVSEGDVRSVPGGEVVPRQDWDRVRLVKIDTEGDEMRVLTGIEPLLHAMPPGSAVLLEIVPELIERRGSTAASVVDFMRGTGFAGQMIDNPYEAQHYLRSGPVRLHALPDPVLDPVDTVWIKG